MLGAREHWAEVLGSRWEYLALALANGLLFAVVNFAMARAVATGHRYRYLGLMGASTIGSAVIGLVLVALDPARGELGRILGYLVCYSAVALLLVVGTARRGRARRTLLAFGLPIALPLLAHEGTFLVSTQSNRVFLLNMIDSGAAGIFAFADTVGNIAVIAATAINSAWTPWYFAHTKTADDALVKRNATQLLGLFIGGLMAVLLISPELFVLVAPDSYATGRQLLPLFIGVGALLFVFNISTNFIIYRQRTAFVLAISVLGAAMNIGLNLTLIPLWGTVGAAVASLTSTFLITSLSLLVSGLLLRCPNLPWPVAAFSVAVSSTLALLVAFDVLTRLPRTIGATTLLIATLLYVTLTRLRSRRPNQ